MNQKARATLVAVAIVTAALLQSRADTYQFIVSGYPAANVYYPSVSPSTSLVTGVRTVPSASASLEARYRTWDRSAGTAFRSDKAGLVILFH